MKKKLSIFFLLEIILLNLPELISANERHFTYVYETLTLPPNVREIEVWNTYRSNRNFFYRRMDQRIEYEFGVSKNLMSAFYLNYSWILQDSNGKEINGDDVLRQEISISSEWKYKLLDRVADPIGLGIYGEATLGLNEYELEGKLLIDKQFNNFLLAFNGVIEHEWESELEKGEIENESELFFEFDLGVAYLINNAFSLGVEIVNYNNINEGSWKNSALFAGPVVSYTSENWWVTLTLLPQLTSIKGATDGKFVLDNHEKIESRLLFSFSL